MRDYFAEQGATENLLEFCSEAGDSWSELCDFLGFNPAPSGDFPKEHVSSETRHKKFRLYYNRAGAYLYGRLAPRMTKKRKAQAPKTLKVKELAKKILRCKSCVAVRCFWLVFLLAP